MWNTWRHFDVENILVIWSFSAFYPLIVFRYTIILRTVYIQGELEVSVRLSEVEYT